MRKRKITKTMTKTLKTSLTEDRISYSDDYNPILEYWQQIENGLIVSDKIRRTYRKIVNDLSIEDGEFFYSPRRANHALEFIENYCKNSKGPMGGKPVRLELWEKAMLATIFGFIDHNGFRKYHKATLIIAKKNGKSLIASAVGLYLLVADCEAGPEVYAVATKRDQAKIIWLESKRMRNKSPALAKKIKALVAELVSDFNDGVFKPLASDVNTLDGLNVHGALMDEFHQWKNGRALYDIIADGVGARDQPLIFLTSTAGTIREDFFDDEYNDCTQLIAGYDLEEGFKNERAIAFIYELDKREEWTDESVWLKANPGLGTIKSLKTLKEAVENAKKNKNLVKNLLCKQFNIRETDTESWLPFDSCKNDLVSFKCKNGHKELHTDVYGLKYPCAECGEELEKIPFEEFLRRSYAIGGCDLSSVYDLTCATLLVCRPNDKNYYVLQKYFLPSARVDVVDADNKMEAPYRKWAEQGWLHICEGASVDYHDVTQWFIDMRDKFDIRPLWVGYDRALAGYWVQEMDDARFDMVKIAQGPITWTYPMKTLGTLFDEHRIIYQNNPILRWCLTNTGKKSTNRDGIESIQPIKFKETRRIDGTVSLLNSFTCLKTTDEKDVSREQEYFKLVR